MVYLSIKKGEKRPTSKGAGLTRKGRRKYNKATGSNLKSPVPYPKTKSQKARKKSFCARTIHWKKYKRGRAARENWKCRN
jgi:hypothetical protein